MKADAKDIKVPRPLNSYIIFRVQKQREIIKQCPGANHRDISKITSKWWRELCPEEKKVYVDEAERLKQEHKLLYPDYKFSPKKRSRSVRPYKKRPSNELIALNKAKKQDLLALYHHGRVVENEELKKQLVNQIEPKPPKKLPKHSIKRNSFSEPPMDTLSSHFSHEMHGSINPHLLYPMDDYYGLSPSYSSIVSSQSPYEGPFFDESPTNYAANYFYQAQQNMYDFVPSEPIYPNIEDSYSLKINDIYDQGTLQQIQLLTRSFPSLE